MDGLRTSVTKKTAKFIKRAQQQPTAPAGTPPASPPPAAGSPADAPKPPPPKPPAPPAPVPPPGGAAPSPLGAPGTPLPKTREEIESDVQKKIEKEKRQEQKLDDLDGKVEEVGDQIKTLTDALVEMKRVIEKGFMGETDLEDKFNILKEKQQDVGNTKLTTSDFGLDNSTFIKGHEEETMDVTKLRQARKERIAQNTLKESDTFEESLDAPKDKNYKQNVVTPNIDKKPKFPEIPDLFKVLALDLNDAETQWTVLNKNTNEVYYTIDASDAEDKELFKTEKFAQNVLHEIKEKGLEPAMDKFKGKPPGDKKDELKEKVLEKKDEKPKDKEPLVLKMPKKDEGPVEKKLPPAMPPKMEGSSNDFQRRFSRALRLALSAQQKNLIDNPLKAAWYDVLDQMDVGNAAQLIETVFSRSAADQFEVAIKKAEEYLALSDEAFVETEATIGDLEVKVPDAAPTTVSASEKNIRASDLRQRAIKASLPLTTQTTEEDRFEKLAYAVPRPLLSGISKFFQK